MRVLNDQLISWPSFVLYKQHLLQIHVCSNTIISMFTLAAIISHNRLPPDLPIHAQEKGDLKKKNDCNYLLKSFKCDHFIQCSQRIAAHSRERKKVLAFSFSRDIYWRTYIPILSGWCSNKQQNPTFKVLLWIPGNSPAREWVRGITCIVLKTRKGA